MKTKSEKATPTTPFAAALSYFSVQKWGWGAQTAVAKKVGVKPAYISELASGKKDGKEGKRRAIANALGHTYENFLWFGELLLGGEPPEKVRLLAGVIQENKAHSELTPEERKAVEQYLSPRLAEAGVAWQDVLNADMALLAKGWNPLLGQQSSKAPPANDAGQPAAESDSFDAAMQSWFNVMKLWCRTEYGDDEAAAHAFFQEFSNRFSEYKEWLAGRSIIKNPEECRIETMKS